MTKSAASKHRRQLDRAKRRKQARALRARLVLAGAPPHVIESARTNDLGILYKLIKWHET